MTLTFSSQNYTDLLVRYQPKKIKTEQEYQDILKILEGMMSQEMNEAEGEFFDLLVLLVENYEAIHYPIAKATLSATLESLMHEFNITSDRLMGAIGSLDLVEAISTGKRDITLSQAESLAQFFNDLSPGLSLTARDFQS